MEKYLASSKIIDFYKPEIQALAKKLSSGLNDDEQIAKNCFLYVRDEIKHLGDYPSDTKACSASEVLEKKTGWCYAKSHLLAALLRANGIPTAFCYQKLSCGEYKKDVYCLHGLNAIYLKKYGWYKVDSRGNKDGVNAQFTPPIEKLAFSIKENEYEVEGFFDEPMDCVVEYLQKYDKHEDMLKEFP